MRKFKPRTDNLQPELDLQSASHKNIALIQNLFDAPVLYEGKHNHDPKISLVLIS